MCAPRPLGLNWRAPDNGRRKTKLFASHLTSCPETQRANPQTNVYVCVPFNHTRSRGACEGWFSACKRAKTEWYFVCCVLYMIWMGSCAIHGDTVRCVAYWRCHSYTCVCVCFVYNCVVECAYVVEVFDTLLLIKSTHTGDMYTRQRHDLQMRARGVYAARNCATIYSRLSQQERAIQQFVRIWLRLPDKPSNTRSDMGNERKILR